MASGKSNPAVIGVFVVGAILLAIVGIIAFGSANLFEKKERFVIFCDESVNGLVEGAAVKFKGVPIGQVVAVTLRFGQHNVSAIVPIFIEIEEGLLLDSQGEDIDLDNSRVFQQQIEAGLRAKLDYESYVTGRLFIELDYYHHAPRPKFYHNKSGYQEIPFLATGLDQIFRSATEALAKIDQIDFVGIGKKVNDVLQKLDTGIGEIDFKRINDAFVQAFDKLQDFINNPQWNNTLVDFNKTLKQIDTLTQDLDQEIEPFFHDARKVLSQVDSAIFHLDGMLQPNSEFRYRFDQALLGISAATQAVADFSSFLERNPKALLTGRAPATSGAL